jgi:hypothetical protein
MPLFSGGGKVAIYFIASGKILHSFWDRYPFRGSGFTGSKVRVHIQSKSLIDRP